MEELLEVDYDSPGADPDTAVTYWGNLKDLGLDYGWGPAALFENIVELFYLNTTIGWAGSIAASTLVLRFVLFYFQRRGSDSMAAMAAMKPVLQPLMDQADEAKKVGDEEKVQLLKSKHKAISVEVGVTALKSFSTPIAQGILGFGAFRCLRGMSTLPVQGMSTEDLLWLHDLTVSDPLWVLPLATGGFAFLIARVCQIYLLELQKALS